MRIHKYNKKQLPTILDGINLTKKIPLSFGQNNISIIDMEPDRKSYNIRKALSYKWIQGCLLLQVEETDS